MSEIKKSDLDIKIAGNDIRVLFVDEHHHKLQDNLGMAFYAENEIYISNAQCNQKQEKTLTHEMIHHIVNTSGFYQYMQDKDLDQEPICALLDNILWQFLKDNTNFFDNIKLGD